MPKRVFAIDPGGTTGVAYRDGDGNVVSLNLSKVVSHTGVGVVCEELRRRVGVIAGDILVIEKFQLPPYGVSSGGDEGVLPLVVYGAIIGVFDGCEIDLSQNAGLAKGTITDARLKRLGLWSKRSPHERDAIRHLLVWERRHISR